MITPALAESDRQSRPARDWTSIFRTIVSNARRVSHDSGLRPNLRTTGADWRSCLDWQSMLFGGGPNVGESGVATSTTATSLTNTGGTFPTSNSGYKGHIIFAGPNASGAGSTVYGVIINNTGTVITVDQWYNASNPGGAAATTPNGTCSYLISPVPAPAWWLALSTDATAPSAADTALASEITTSGLARALWGTFTHTSGATSLSLAKTWTASGTQTVNKEAIFNAQNSGAMPFESAEPSPPTVVSGDTLTNTVTLNI